MRVEKYAEGSYNENPPSVLGRNIDEHKFEIQGTYTHSLNSIFSVSNALLHHTNFTFDDNYQWAIATLAAKIPLSEKLVLTPNASLEKRLLGGRPFRHTSTTLDYTFAEGWTFEANLRRYENRGVRLPSYGRGNGSRLHPSADG